MARKLEFLLMGAARSGTTAVTAAVNCHPLVFCGMEAVEASDCHTNISFPESFERKLSRMSGAQYRSLKGLLDAKKETAFIIGNKQPRYDVALRDIVRSMPQLRLIFIYRNPMEFMNSWNKRAADAADSAWSPGQRGLFGIVSLFSYLRALQHIDRDCLVVPYRGFSEDIAGTTLQIVRYLGVKDGSLLASEPAIAQLQRAADSLRNRPREVLRNESEFLKAIAIQELETIFDRDRTFCFSEIHQRVHLYLQSIRGAWGQAFVEALVRYGDPEAILYFRKTLRQPCFAEMIAEEAALSKPLRRYLRALPRSLKLRRIFLGQNGLEPCERFMRQVEMACAG